MRSYGVSGSRSTNATVRSCQKDVGVEEDRLIAHHHTSVPCLSEIPSAAQEASWTHISMA
jgi:hypothetical protein